MAVFELMGGSKVGRVPRTGEQVQLVGSEGSQRAKRWLESTCRAEVKWNNPTVGVNKLQFRKAGAAPDSEAQGDSFSFDLGGTLLGGDVDGEMFAAETKKYASALDQGTEYRKFVAKCYRVEVDHGQFFDHFLWITWAPFLVNSWNELVGPSFIRKVITEDDDCQYIALGSTEFDPSVGAAVAGKLLIVVLSDRQEVVLSLHGNELAHVRKALLDIRSAQ